MYLEKALTGLFPPFCPFLSSGGIAAAPPRPAIATGRDSDAAAVIGVRRGRAVPRHRGALPPPPPAPPVPSALPRERGKRGREGGRGRPSPRGPFLNASVRQRRGGEQVPEELSLRSHSPLRRGRANYRLTDPRDQHGRGPARRHKKTHPDSIPVRAPRRGVPRV